MPSLTSEGLRSELQRFAETTMRSELAEFATVLPQDLAAALLENLRHELQSIINSCLQAHQTISPDQSRNLGASMLTLPKLGASSHTLPTYSASIAGQSSHTISSISKTEDLKSCHASYKAGTSELPKSVAESEQPRSTRVPSDMELAKEKVALMRKAVATSPAVVQELKDLGYFDQKNASKPHVKQERVVPEPEHSTQAVMLRLSEKQNEALTPSATRDYQLGAPSVLERCVRSRRFEYAVLFVIMLNALFIGFETDAVAKDVSASDSLIFKVFGMMFMLIFAGELALKICVFRSWFFKSKTPLGRQNPNLFWNVFDTFLVGAQVLEYILRALIDFEDSVLGKVTMLRLLRILRVGRLFRVGKLLRLFRTLRTIVHSISHSWQLFLWALISLLVITYLFAVYITEVVSADLTAEAVDPKLKEHFGSVPTSMLSFAKAATGGIDWGDLYTPLSEASTLAALPFFVCVMFLLIVVMNVFAGVFLNSVSQRADQENELELLSSAYSIFNASDHDGSGKIGKADFQANLTHPDVQQFFKAIDLDVQQAEVLFELLDMSNDGFISCDEFLRGCLRLRGATKALDLLILSREVTQLFDGIVSVEMENAEIARIQRMENAEIARVQQQMLAEITTENHRLLTRLCPNEG